MSATSFYSEEELEALGLSSCGRNVQISRKASIYGARRTRIASNVRIDDFCVISAGEGGIDIGNYVHIGASTCLFGHAEILLEDFVAVSGRCGIYSGSDDFTGIGVAGPSVPDELRLVDSRPVHLAAHTLIGTGSTILPGSTMGRGSVLGAMSLANGDYDEFTIYQGVPARRMPGRRSRAFLDEVKHLPLDG